MEETTVNPNSANTPMPSMEPMDPPSSSLPEVPVKEVFSQPVPKAKNNRAVLLIVILLLLVGGTVWYIGNRYFSSKSLSKQASSPQQMTSSPSPTLDSFADWKTYQHSNPSFSFKYPSDFVSKNPTVKDAVLLAGNNNFQLQIEWSSNKDKYVEEIEDISQGVAEKDLGMNMIKTDKYTAYLQSIQSAGGDFSFSRDVLIPLDDSIVKLTVSPKNDADFSAAEDLANQILSTFTMSGIENKQYRSSVNHILFTYPRCFGESIPDSQPLQTGENIQFSKPTGCLEYLDFGGVSLGVNGIDRGDILAGVEHSISNREQNINEEGQEYVIVTYEIVTESPDKYLLEGYYLKENGGDEKGAYTVMLADGRFTKDQLSEVKKIYKFILESVVIEK